MHSLKMFLHLFTYDFLWQCLPQSPECWDCRHVPPCPDGVFTFKLYYLGSKQLHTMETERAERENSPKLSIFLIGSYWLQFMYLSRTFSIHFHVNVYQIWDLEHRI
jgi:hypothetical protein